MQDIVFPKGNEAEFIAMAKSLGFSGLICAYEKKSEFSKDPFVQNALLVKPESVRIAKEAGILTVCSASREALERGADIVFDFELFDGKDKMHYRESGLNQVFCKIAAQNKVKIGFSMAHVLESSGKDRAVLFGRLMQNFMLCRKFKVSVRIASFATSPYGMRAPAELLSLFKDLGMDAAVAKSALH